MTSERARKRAWESLDPSMFILEDEDNRSLLRLFFGLQVQLLFDSPIASTNHPSIDAISRWISYVTSNKYFDVMTKLSAIALDIHNDRFSLSLSKERDREFWKALPLKEELFGLSSAWTPEMHKFVLSFLLFCKKALYTDESLVEEATLKWLQTDAEIKDDFPPTTLEACRFVMSHLCKEFDMTGLVHPRFKHGPGSTSDGSGRILQLKHETLKNVPCFSLFLYRRYRGQTGVVAYAERLTATPTYLDLAAAKQHTRWMGQLSPFHRSTIRHVRKDHKGPRTICMESSPMMYFQQGVSKLLDENITRILGFYINLHSQDQNKNLARLGSIDGKTSTIDLSSASDTVSLSLVKYLFKDTQLEELLPSLTSNMTEVPGHGEIRMRKFAPMGSALCFPVQCLVFLSAVLTVYMRYVPIEKLVEGVTSPFSAPSVFGDDLIVDSTLYSEVLEVLVDLGFKPNVDKSFSTSTRFRESCGGWYYRGFDVTPYFLQLRESKLRDTYIRNPFSLTSFASAINRADEFNYSRLRLSLISFYQRSFRMVGKQKTVYLRFQSRSEPWDGLSILTDRPRPKVKWRWNRPRVISVNRSQVYHMRVTSRPSGGHHREKYYTIPKCLIGADETGRLTEWLYAADQRRFSPMTDTFNDLRDNVIYSPACVGWVDVRPILRYEPRPRTLRRIAWKWMPG